MKCIGLCAALALAAAEPAAHAQDIGPIAGALAGAAQGVGQALGSAATNGSNVFVTATGHASAGASAEDVFTVTIDGQAASAAGAARLYDEHIKAAKALAAQFHVDTEVGSIAFDTVFKTPPRVVPPHAPGQGNALVDMPSFNEADRVFQIGSEVRFSSANRNEFADFLDALKGAGLLKGQIITRTRAADVLGLGAAARVDDVVWDRALGEAMTQARRQARAVAAAAGRELGEVKQVSVVATSERGEQASVTIAVSFAFAPR